MRGLCDDDGACDVPKHVGDFPSLTNIFSAYQVGYTN